MTNNKRVTIGCSSSDLIADKYKDDASVVCAYLASHGYDLNWGAGTSSLMGICYEVFNKYHRHIYGYTTPKYVSLLNDLSNANHKVYKTTFDLRKNLFKDGDLIIILPGGTGSVSEFFAYLEEVRSNDVNKKIILYNASHHFDTMLSLINDLVQREFSNQSIYDYFSIINSFDEFKDLLE